MKHGNCLLYALGRWIRSGRGRIVFIRNPKSRAGFTTWYVSGGRAYSFTSHPKYNGCAIWFRGREREITPDKIYGNLD